MRSFPLLLMSLVPMALLADDPAGAAPPEQLGVSTDWDVRGQLSAAAQQVRVLQNLLGSAKPQEWAQKGAPQGYVRQLKAAQSLIANMIVTSDRLAREPARLTAALETYLYMSDLQQMGASLGEGVRKYQSPTLADRLAEELSNTAVNREKLRAHLADLSRVQEEERKIMSEEAQRCRGMISKQVTDPQPVRRAKPKTAKP